MFDYEVLRLIWWLLLGVLIVAFVIMDGFDLGVAVIFRFVAKNKHERHLMLSAIEPVWEGNQVWLVLGIGAVFAAWPALYAAFFSGFYGVVFGLLVCLILRPVGFNFREKVKPQYQALWDWSLCLGAAFATLLFGLLIGNVFSGIPFQYDQDLRLHFEPAINHYFNSFSILCGFISLSMFVMHGAVYAALKLRGRLQQDAAIIAQLAALSLFVLFLLGGFVLNNLDGQVIASEVDPNQASNPLGKHVVIESGAWLARFKAEPWFYLAPGLGLIGLLMTVFLSRLNRFTLAFMFSALSQFGVIASIGLSLFPFLLPSSLDAGSSLTVWDASSSQLTLAAMLIAVCVLLPLVIIYTAWVFRVFKGPVVHDEIGTY